MGAAAMPMVLGAGAGALMSDDPLKGALLGGAGGGLLGGMGLFGGAGSVGAAGGQAAANNAIANQLMNQTAVGGALSGASFVNPLTTNAATASLVGQGAGILSPSVDMLASPLLPATSANQAATAAVPGWLGDTRKFFNGLPGSGKTSDLINAGQALQGEQQQQPQPMAHPPAAPAYQVQPPPVSNAEIFPYGSKPGAPNTGWQPTAGFLSPWG